MSLKAYRDDIRLNEAKLAIVERATEIAETTRAGGDSLSLRQLYYRFVALDRFPDDWRRSWTGTKWILDPAGTKNNDPNYKRLGDIINDARWAGLFDWDYIVDRTRNVRGGDGSDDDPKKVVEELWFYAAMWDGQTERVEVWVEKDALVEVVGRACEPLRTPYFSCRGYTSASEVKAAAERIEGYLDAGAEHVTVLHLGDHDPSGIDMTRDIEERLNLFLDGDGYDAGALEINRIALNMDQVREHKPPPNPAKITDSRAVGYIAEFGQESWELDALEPRILRELIDGAIRDLIDMTLWKERQRFQADGQATLSAFSSQYDRIHDFLAAEGLLS